MGNSNFKTKTDDKQEKKEESKYIEELKQKTEEFENKYKRVLADYQNLEKRVVEERKEWILKANKYLLLHLLPVLDTLVLAEKNSKVQDQGLSLGIKQFLDVLENENVKRIETIGKNYDPHLMECIDTAEGEVDKVIKEFRSGYSLYAEVLRPAQVQVGSAKQNQ